MYVENIIFYNIKVKAAIEREHTNLRETFVSIEKFKIWAD